MLKKYLKKILSKSIILVLLFMKDYKKMRLNNLKQLKNRFNNKNNRKIKITFNPDLKTLEKFKLIILCLEYDI